MCLLHHRACHAIAEGRTVEKVNVNMNFKNNFLVGRTFLIFFALRFLSSSGIKS